MNTNYQQHLNQTGIKELMKINSTAMEVLYSEFFDVRSVCNRGITFYVACDICRALEISNTSKAIHNIIYTHNNNSKKVTFKTQIDSVNPFRKVHVVSIESVIQIILNDSSKKCIELKEIIKDNFEISTSYTPIPTLEDLF